MSEDIWERLVVPVFIRRRKPPKHPGCGYFSLEFYTVVVHLATVKSSSGSCERDFFIRYMRHFFEDMLAITNKAGVYMPGSTAGQTVLQSPHSVLTVKFSERTLRAYLLQIITPVKELSHSRVMP